MKSDAKAFLFDLLETPSPTGFEVPGQRKWATYIGQFADRVENDAYGTAWATIDGSAKKPATIMLEAHADEIGFIVKYVTSEGFIHIDRIGGSDAATARGRRVLIYGDKAPVKGIIGNTAIHIRDNLSNEKSPKVHELYVDIGASNRSEVEKAGIRVGHPAVYADKPEEYAKGKIVSRALDNRIGGFIIAQVMENLSKKRPTCTVYCVNAVQEEIGGHGARMVTHRLMPDVAVCLDVTHATDTPGIKKELHGDVKLGGGPSVTHGTCNHPLVVEKLMSVAKEQKIKLQHEASSRYSGTDTDSIYNVNQGVPSGLVSLPLRYMHSVVEVIDLKDVEQIIKLLTAFCQSVKSGDNFAIKL